MACAILRLYRVVEDAWADGLRAWCEAASQAALEGGAQCWLVVGHLGQVRWIKHKALRESITLFGIRFLEPAMLREELCALIGITARSFRPETAELVLKAVAAQHSATAGSILQTPGALLRAMDDLFAAGWSGDELGLPAELVRHASKNLRRAHCWWPAIDRELLARSDAKQRLWSCFVGLDAACFPELNLLEATARCSARCEFYVALPRPSDENLQHGWAETLKERLAASAAVCVSIGFRSESKALLARLEGTEFAAESARPPRLLVGRDWRDAVQLVRDDVLVWLSQSSSADEHMVIVAPERSPSAVAVTRALLDTGVALFDETGENIEPAPALLVQAQIARYHLLGQDASALIELCKLLNEAVPDMWRWLSPDTVHELLTDAFCSVQSRDARMLTCAWSNLRSGVWQHIVRVVEILGRWDEKLTWARARKKWARCLAQLGFSTEPLEPLWSRTRGLLPARHFPARIFLEHLQAVLAIRAGQRAPEAASPHARVVLTTLADALNQTWNRVLFLDSNEGGWPHKPEENPFLDDAARMALNRRRGARSDVGYLLTSADHWAVEQARVLDLIEHCSGEVVFAAVTREPENTQLELQPNDWVVRCAMAADGGKNALASWDEAIRVCEPPHAPVLAPGERAHLETVHASRRDPRIPFDRYLFNFHESLFEPEAWPVTRLDLAITCPATFALDQLFNAAPVHHSGFRRNQGAAVGLHAHAWLLRALGGTETLQPLPRADPRSALEAEIVATVAQFTECFGREGSPLPLWWKTCLREAAWMARRCLAQLAKLDVGAWFYAMEKEIDQTVQTPDGMLRLKGRFDLLLADRASLKAARVIIVDFKTGKSETPRLATLGKGIGNQFAAYFLMAKDSGAASVTAGIIRPDAVQFEPVFSDKNEPALRAALAPLARLQRDLNFGQRGPLVAERGRCERLPMATVPIDRRVLESKAALVPHAR